MADAFPIREADTARAQLLKKPRRRGRRLGIACMLLLLLLGILVWAAPGLVANSALKNTLLAKATADIRGKVEVGSVSLAWFHPVQLHDVSITDEQGRKVLSAAHVVTSKTLLGWLQDRTDLGTLTVEQPRLDVTVERGSTNLETVLAHYVKDDGQPPPTERTPLHLVVNDGTITVRDAAKNETTQLQSVHADIVIPRLRTDALIVKVHATGKPGEALDAEVNLAEAGNARLQANRFDLATLSPVLSRFDAGTTASGLLTTNLNLDWKPGTSAAEFNAQGHLHVDDLTVAARWLGDDVLKLKAADMPLSVTSQAGLLKVEQAKLTCDVGTASVRGTIDPSDWNSLLHQPGLLLDADVDVSKLASLLPHRLRLKTGTELNSGRLTLHLQSNDDPKALTWSGSAKSTALTGSRDGKPLNWEQPLAVTFQGHLQPDGDPHFDQLTVQSDFIGAQARGNRQSFVAIANVNLDRLSQRLDEFFDLGGLKLSGAGEKLLVQMKPHGTGYQLTANGTLRNVVIADARKTWANESLITLALEARGQAGADGHWRMETGTLQFHADKDELDLQLLEPIARLAELTSGKAKVTLLGDLGRWRNRFASVVSLPKDWVLGGEARPATAVVTFGETLVAKDVKVILRDAVFQGAGLNIREPDLRLQTADPRDNQKLQAEELGQISISRNGAISFRYCTLSSETLSAASERLDITLDKSGEYGASGVANIVTRLDRLQQMVQLPARPTESETIRGIATGKVQLNAPTFQKLGFSGDLKIASLSYGLSTSPTLFEPEVFVKADGEFNSQTDQLTIRSAEINRNGLATKASGTIGKLGTTVEVNLSGDVTYDLAKLEPELRRYLGKTATAEGADTRPFRLSGNLMAGSSPLSVGVGARPDSLPATPSFRSDLSHISGRAGLSWKALKAYGFTVGGSELNASLQDGVVTTNPISATFGGGQISVEPTLNLDPKFYDLKFKPGKIIDQAKLTPEACAQALGYALPAIANTAQADGTFSFDLAENRLPLADLSKGTMQGRLTIHDATVAPGPIISQLVDALGMQQPKLQLSKGNVVPIRMQDGRVYHKDFILNVGGTNVTSAGSVGIDGTLDVVLSVPVGGAIAEKLVPNRPVIQKAIAKQMLSVNVAGTMSKPALNRDAMKAQIGKMLEGAVRDAAKEAGQGLVDDALKKGLEGFLKPPVKK